MIEIVDIKEDESWRYCKFFPYGYVPCNKGCDKCFYKFLHYRNENIKRNEGVLFTWHDALNQTKKEGGDVWLRSPIILSKECVERLGLDKNMFYQIAVAISGPGCYKKEPVGIIECCLYVAGGKQFTITRNEAYGIPNGFACRRYDELFYSGLERAVKVAIANNKKGAWCL